MRYLTVKREKRYAGSLSKMKVYIEDPAANELTISGTPCRKLGVLKNGAEETFRIGDGAAKVFVIAGKLSRSYCSDFYQLPEGSENITLTGRNRFDLAGNAFRFDNNESPEAAENRKRTEKRGRVIMLLAAVLGVAIGFLAGSAITKSCSDSTRHFSSKGMDITLTRAFRETTEAGFTAVYESNDAAVFALKEPFSLAEGAEKLTVEEYRDLTVTSNGLTNAEIKDYDGVPGFEYVRTNSQNGETYRYRAYCYKVADAFWLVQFAFADKDTQKLAPKVDEWAASISFSEARQP